MYYAPSYSAPVYYDSANYDSVQGMSVVPEGATVVPNTQLSPGPANALPAIDANKAPVNEPSVNPLTPPANQSQPSGDNKDTSTSGDARLQVQLPADAIVYVNGKRTRTEGALRSYVSRHLDVGRQYPYEVKAVVVRNGQELTQTKVVDLSAGLDKSIAFDFDADAELLTSLSISVPEDAKIVLDGTPTSTAGSFRYFSTKALAPGQVWSKYEVSATVVRDGKEITRRKVIRLSAGDSQQLAFDFDNDETMVAAK